MLHGKKKALLKMTELHEINEKIRPQEILAYIAIISTG